MRRLDRWIGLLVAAVLVFGAAGCGGSQPAPSAPAQKTGEDLVAAAKKEGALHLYGGAGLNIMEPLAKGFEAKYGIKVEITRNGSERNFQKILQEAEQGIKHADVVITADEAHFQVFKNGARGRLRGAPGRP